MTQVILRDYQSKAVEMLRDGIRAGHRKQVLMSPTGSGKTEIACSMLAEANRKRSRALFIVDRVVLVDQTSERLDRYFIPHGVMQADHWRFRAYEQIQVCSAQTIEKRGIPEDVAVVFIDEAHCMRKAVTKFIAATDAIVVGLTATPFTKGMGKVYSNLVNVTTMNELIAQEFLVPLKTYAARAIDVEGMKVIAGEWSEKEIEERGLDIIGDIVAEWHNKTEQHFGGPAKTIVFSATVDHGAELCRQFNAAGFNFQQISYRDGHQERRRDIVEEFRKPDSTIHGLVSCEVFTKGFDVPDVMCLAEGSKVLTRRGEVAIEKLLLSDRIWDGIEFVEHDGPIFKGEQDVIEYAGLVATEGHEVRTAQGWCTFGQCAREQIAIVQTGLNGTAIRESEGHFAGGDVGRQRVEKETSRAVRVRNLWQSIKCVVGLVAGFASARLRSMQVQRAVGAMASGASQVHEGALYESDAQGLSGLWRARDQVLVRFAEAWRGVDSGQPRNSFAGSRDAIGSDQQRRKLRAGESSLGLEDVQCQQYAARWLGRKDAQISDRPSARQVRGQDASQSTDPRFDGSADIGTVQPTIRQAKRRVWDVLNAGPRNRFTCEGLLVHNCGISARPYRKSLSSHIQQMGRIMRPAPGKKFGLWMDHSGNALRFMGDVVDIFEAGLSELDDGKLESKPRKEPTKEQREQIRCSCGYVMLVYQTKCPGCGRERKRPANIEALPGTMVELDGKAANKKYTWDQKQQFIAGLRGYAMQRGYQSGWVAHQYNAKFGVWPNDQRLKNQPAGPVTIEVQNWIRSQQIRFAKSRKAA